MESGPGKSINILISYFIHCRLGRNCGDDRLHSSNVNGLEGHADWDLKGDHQLLLFLPLFVAYHLLSAPIPCDLQLLKDWILLPGKQRHTQVYHRIEGMSIISRKRPEETCHLLHSYQFAARPNRQKYPKHLFQLDLTLYRQQHLLVLV